MPPCSSVCVCPGTETTLGLSYLPLLDGDSRATEMPPFKQPHKLNSLYGHSKESSHPPHLIKQAGHHLRHNPNLCDHQRSLIDKGSTHRRSAHSSTDPLSNKHTSQAHHGLHEQTFDDRPHPRHCAVVFPSVSLSNSLLQQQSSFNLLCVSENDDNEKSNSDGDEDAEEIPNFKSLPTAKQKDFNDISVYPGNLRNQKPLSANQLLRGDISQKPVNRDNKVNDKISECLNIGKMKSSNRMKKAVPQARATTQNVSEALNSRSKNAQAAKLFHLCPQAAYQASKPDMHLGSECNKLMNKTASPQDKIPKEVSVNVLSRPNKFSSAKTHNKLLKSVSSASRCAHLRKTASIEELRHKGSDGCQQTKDRKIAVGYRKHNLSAGSDMVTKAPRVFHNSDHQKENFWLHKKPTQKQSCPEEAVKMAGQRSKCRTAGDDDNFSAKLSLRRRQRQEIYALNSVMTELENARFDQFMNNLETSDLPS